MYLSRIVLDSDLREVKRAVSSPQVLHAAVEACFETKGRNLWRLDFLHNAFNLLLVSETTPNFSGFEKQFCASGVHGETKEYLPLISNIKQGQKLRFRLKGNTVRSLVTEKGKRGKVVPHVTDSHKRDWLRSKSESNGFLLEENSFDLIETGRQRFWRESKQVDLTYGVFEGLLEITDTELFMNALTRGIGRAKGYGYGLMTVMGVR